MTRVQYAPRLAAAAAQARGSSIQARFAAALATLIPSGVVGRRSVASAATPALARQANLGGKSFEALFKSAAQREGLDEGLVKAVAEAESGFRQEARSSAGAIGLMQLMPSTAKSLGVNPYDAAGNVAGGARYLKTMLDRFGSVPLALAAYNAGPGAVEKYGGIPPYQETKTYVDRVLQITRRNDQTDNRLAKEEGNGGQPTA